MASAEGKFTLGAVEILPGAQQALQDASHPAAAYLYCHPYATPDEPIGPGTVMSSFALLTGTIMVVTDVARIHTLVMTAADPGRLQTVPSIAPHPWPKT